MVAKLHPNMPAEQRCNLAAALLLRFESAFTGPQMKKLHGTLDQQSQEMV